MHYPYIIRMPVAESFDVDTGLEFDVSELMYKKNNELKAYLIDPN